jgi:DNA-binding NarL/FixJ family response regulator
MVEPTSVDDADKFSECALKRTAVMRGTGTHAAFHRWLEISGTTRTEFVSLLTKVARRNRWPIAELGSCLSWISTIDTSEPMPPRLLRTVLDEVAVISQEATTVVQRMSVLHQAGANLANVALWECTHRFQDAARASADHRCGSTDFDAGETAVALTHREKQVLQLASSGNSNRQIARTLGLAEQTVKNHLTSTYTKLNATDRTSAVLAALRQHLIADPGSTAIASGMRRT